jgi:hypothetical protein
MLISEQAAIEALADFRREYESEVCVVCKSEKWRLYPFCRSCSIKLQRSHLMARFVELVKRIVWILEYSRTAEPIERDRDLKNWPNAIVQQYFRHYDICRDFLVNMRKRREDYDPA